MVVHVIRRWTTFASVNSTCFIIPELFSLRLYGYKLPVLKYEHNHDLKSGYGYLYMTPNTNGEWKLSKKSINDSTSFLGHTLSPLYSTDIRKELLYLSYNDDPPSHHAASSSFGHSKGVVMLRGNNGLWLVHSSPRFPKEYMTVEDDKKKNKKYHKYYYPFSATKNGQSFLCLSFASQDMDKIGIILQYVKPKVYDYHLPIQLKNQYPNLVKAAQGAYQKGPPYHHKTILITAGGSKFTSYVKSSKFRKDLYSDWLTEELEASLEVETWRNGNGAALPSESKNTHHVFNVKELEFDVPGHRLLFPYSKDHSKWAITYRSTKSVICIGDINRMESQFKRGGGTICHESYSIWKNYQSAIKELQSLGLNGTNECPSVTYEPPFSTVPSTGTEPSNSLEVTTTTKPYTKKNSTKKKKELSSTKKPQTNKNGILKSNEIKSTNKISKSGKKSSLSDDPDWELENNF